MMKLLSITLNNFKGIKNFTLDAQGEDLEEGTLEVYLI